MKRKTQMFLGKMYFSFLRGHDHLLWALVEPQIPVWVFLCAGLTHIGTACRSGSCNARTSSLLENGNKEYGPKLQLGSHRFWLKSEAKENMYRMSPTWATSHDPMG
jgi:hypothetical protein